MIEQIDVLDLAVISYEDFMRSDPEALRVLKHELHENGIIGMRGIPGFKSKVSQFIEANRAFSALPDEIKDKYAPDRSQGHSFIGYEKGKEKFQRPDGRWVVDDLKNSYYGVISDPSANKWPKELDLETPYFALGNLMAEMGIAVMEKIGLVGGNSSIALEGFYLLGRMLHYKGVNSIADNPLWCGPHFDHGLITSLIPAHYFVDGIQVPEPPEAGLYIKTSSQGVHKKVIANDLDVMMFQVGEFAQLASDDAIVATEHHVHKAHGFIDRYAMALFIDGAMDTVVHSNSVLANDSRYGAKPGEACTYQHWHEETFKRFLLDDEHI